MELGKLVGGLGDTLRTALLFCGRTDTQWRHSGSAQLSNFGIQTSWEVLQLMFLQQMENILNIQETKKIHSMYIFLWKATYLGGGHFQMENMGKVRNNKNLTNPVLKILKLKNI